jgi:copper chaperone NosL
VRLLLALVAAAAASSCAGGVPGPAALDTKTETCRSCRMPVSDARLAAQLVAPGEEPRFFDEIGCLRDFLRISPAGRGAVAYVADYRTRGWVRAASAVYSRGTIETPMGSRLLAHADAASRERDPAARGAMPLTPREVFGGALPPDVR